MQRTKEYLALVETAKLAAQSSYAPYSKLAQGAALLCSDGKIFSGSKMECAAYGGTVAAETAALTAAVTAGARKFVAIAVHPAQFPCGTSRQMLAEFGINLDVVLEIDGSGGEISVISLSELLPLHFGPENLS
ncbi:MAG: cytidine deaminase [Leptolyngbya sp.]|nr:cytidine deaminase [Candidatus Melainabacteria bacterium]